jgi:PAS domain S-box-containing protein
VILEANGFEVHTACTGQEGLRQARQSVPDLVLLDVRLPDTSGYDVCQELKLDPVTMDTVVLLISGLGARTNERVAGLEWGADGYLKKPVDPNELVATINALLRIRYAQERACAASGEADACRARLMTMTDASPIAIITTDLGGIIREWNPAAQRLFGYSKQEIHGASIAQLTHHDYVRQWQEVWDLVCNGEHVRGEETVRMHKDGRPLRVYVNVCPVRDDAGRVIGVSEVDWEVSPVKDWHDLWPAANSSTLAASGI